MNWQQLVTLAIILTIAVVFVWRGSSAKKSGGCGCGCAHGEHGEQDREKAAR